MSSALFTAPKAGLYWFMVEMAESIDYHRHGHGQYFPVQLMINGTAKITISHHNQQQQQQYAWNLQKGDQVEVKRHGRWDFLRYVSDYQSLQFKIPFSGTLIQEF